jgi:hypothetical protein
VVGFVFLRQAFLRQAFLRQVFLRQTQGAQPVHVLKGGCVARRLLLQCLIDFRFSPLIAV